MADGPTVGFAPFAIPSAGVLIVFCDETLKLGSQTRKLLGASADLVTRAARADRFKGKSGTSLDLLAPADLTLSRLVVVGCGKAAEMKSRDFLKLGGIAMGKIPAAAESATILAELPNRAMSAEQAADLAQGVRLRAYAFDRYKTKRKDDEEKPAAAKIQIGVADVARARAAWSSKGALADAVMLARDLINEPANVLYP